MKKIFIYELLIKIIKGPILLTMFASLFIAIFLTVSKILF